MGMGMKSENVNVHPAPETLRLLSFRDTHPTEEHGGFFLRTIQPTDSGRAKLSAFHIRRAGAEGKKSQSVGQKQRNDGLLPYC